MLGELLCSDQMPCFGERMMNGIATPLIRTPLALALDANTVQSYVTFKSFANRSGLKSCWTYEHFGAYRNTFWENPDLLIAVPLSNLSACLKG